MIHYYYIILIILTGLGSSFMTSYGPKLKARYNAYKTRLKHKRNDKLRTIIKEEIRNVLIELKNEQ